MWCCGQRDALCWTQVWGHHLLAMLWRLGSVSPHTAERKTDQLLAVLGVKDAQKWGLGKGQLKWKRINAEEVNSELYPDLSRDLDNSRVV